MPIVKPNTPTGTSPSTRRGCFCTPASNDPAATPAATQLVIIYRISLRGSRPSEKNCQHGSRHADHQAALLVRQSDEADPRFLPGMRSRCGGNRRRNCSTACHGGSARRRSLGNATPGSLCQKCNLAIEPHVTRPMAAIHVPSTIVFARSVPTIRIKPARIDVKVPISMKQQRMRGSVQCVLRLRGGGEQACRRCVGP